jgi:hypothetical protein
VIANNSCIHLQLHSDFLWVYFGLSANLEMRFYPYIYCMNNRFLIPKYYSCDSFDPFLSVRKSDIELDLNSKPIINDITGIIA